LFVSFVSKKEEPMTLHHCKSFRIKLVALMAAVCVLTTAGSASAGPFNPSYRGEPNSVHAVFDWQAPATDWITSAFTALTSSYPLDITPAKASDDGMDTMISLPNFIDELELKLMRIQLFFDEPVSVDSIGIEVIAHDPLPTTSQQVGSSGPGTSVAHYIDFEIRPNPDAEWITIFGNTGGGVFPGNLRSIEIDTISIPEPGTLALSALGLLGIVCCRRKQV
jgi:hypothetical protein